MSRPRACSLALLLLSLIALQYVSATSVTPQSTPQSTQKQAAVPSKAKSAANSKKEQQYQEEPYHGIREVPEGIVDIPEYDIRDPGPAKGSYGSKQRPDGPDSYRERPRPEERRPYNKHDDRPGPDKRDEPYGGPRDQDSYGEEKPKAPSEPEVPCPKAMTADAVENGKCDT